MTLNITAVQPEHWKYVSEGGASIVFSYQGPPHPHFDGTVLRLRKIPYNNAPTSATPEVAEEPDDPTIQFQQQIIQRLIPVAHLPRLESVEVQREWLEELQRLADVERPAERRAKDRIDVCRRKAVLATDLVGGNALAVEIKPKWGFLPSTAHLTAATLPIKSMTCRYCMHSYLKAAKGEEVCFDYCPLDLYSGDEIRVRRALNALFDAWVGSSGAINNLRVFAEGTMVKPSLRPSSLGPLAKHFPRSVAEEATLSKLQGDFVAALIPLLLGTPVLRILSTLQRTLDALDIEGLSALWAAAHQSAAVQVAADPASVAVPPLGAGLTEPTIADWQAFLDIFLTKHAQMDHDHPDSANVKYYCMAYILSASFKDCSIILRIPQDGPATVTVIDLDVKPVEKLSTWAKLDAQIVDEYRGIPEPANCVARL
ncbi:hypothetical protein NM688_g6133 [Phlebia brevispora]|uniref:Uncharacterized protein n=1 Tax=Phlebia brevispora TaxID=194682 RepID=A0ACC1SJD0_9APHY|nr:hypothetical protein NM688_g6133 [Phlebia brevispora]